ncbi:MAG TPA: MarR family transcriptional regulator [Pseudolabrys sp.]|nr:MarR family transcriptional regulator [Pseudolabrys sp.]
MNVAARPIARANARSTGKQRLRLWIRLLRSTRAIEADVRERLRVQFAMTLPQFDVMAALARKQDGMTMTDLSRALMVSNGNVTGIIDRLAAENYVVRHAPAEDRRSFIVRLTPKGAARFSSVAAAHENWINELLSDFGAEQMESLIEDFDGLAERIREGGSRP